jgi:hypothetical protein
MADNKNLSSYLFTVENAKLYKLDPYEYLRCIFDQAPYCQSEKDFEKLLPMECQNYRISRRRNLEK